MIIPIPDTLHILLQINEFASPTDTSHCRAPPVGYLYSLLLIQLDETLCYCFCQFICFLVPLFIVSSFRPLFISINPVTCNQSQTADAGRYSITQVSSKGNGIWSRSRQTDHIPNTLLLLGGTELQMKW